MAQQTKIQELTSSEMALIFGMICRCSRDPEKKPCGGEYGGYVYAYGYFEVQGIPDKDKCQTHCCILVPSYFYEWDGITEVCSHMCSIM